METGRRGESSAMNSRERILSILSGVSPDRPAWAMTLSLYGARLTGCPLPVYFSDPSAYVSGQIAIKETFNPDVLFGPFAFAHLGAAFGSTIKEFSDQAPTLRNHSVSSPSDLTRIILPDPTTNPYLQYHLTAIANLVQTCGKETPVAAILPLPIDLPALILGMETWMETILFDPEGTRLVIDILVPFFLDFADRIFANGADFIVSPCAFSSPSLVTRDIVRSFARPILERTLSRMKGPVVIHHGGAPVLPHLDLLSGLPGVIGYVVDSNDNLAEARAVIGKDSVLFGGPDNLSVPVLTADEIHQRCTTILKERAGDPKFVLCNSGPDIPLNTPPENIHAFRKATVR